MVSLLVLLFLLLPLCVRDSPTPTSPLTSVKRYENSSTENSLNITSTEAPINHSTNTSYDTSVLSTVPEKETDVPESVTTNYSSSSIYPTIQANSVNSEQSSTSPNDLDIPTSSESTNSSEISTTENEPGETSVTDNTNENSIENSSTEDTFQSSSTTSTIDNAVISTEATVDSGASGSPELSTGMGSTRDPKSIDVTKTIDNEIPTTTAALTSTTPVDTTTPVDITTPVDTTAPVDTTTPVDSSTPSTSTEDKTAEDEDNGTHVGLIIGIIIAILLIGVCIVLWRAHQSGKFLWPPKNLFSNGLSDPVRPQAVALKKFPAHCSEMLNIPSKLSHEYQLLATLSLDIYATESFVAGQLPDNKCKNRYVNILPFDSTRVKLGSEGEEFSSDYINASYIKGYTNDVEYIATQGPKEETCRDFWKMVYQEPIKVIIMVTQLEEQGKPKCYKYYPDLRENMELEDIVVRCTTELHFPIYTSRTLILTKGERKRSIIHLHFREWPDFGCPATPDLMLQFCQVMRHNIVLAQPGVTLIHCSAGVGRTGTLIAVDILLQHIKESKKIDIFGTVYKLRKHRMNMVQSEAQYVYIYKCVKEALEDPSYLSSENSSTTSLEPIYENIECTRLSRVSSKIVQEAVISENECAL